MSVATRSMQIGVVTAALVLLAGCDSTSQGTESGANTVQSAGSANSAGSAGGAGGFSAAGGLSVGTHNSIVATPESNLVSVQVGQKKTVAVTFTSNDAQPIQGFGLTNTTLPAGWTGPSSSFGCARVDSGSSCVLNLVYAPTDYESGKSVTLNYVYVDNAGTPVTNAVSGASIAMSFGYQATTDDVVNSDVAPVGQIVADTHGGSQPVTVSFATSDTHPASALQITAADQLADFTPPATAGCDTVSAGVPCVLTWLFQPTTPDNGMVTFAYTYTDDSGTAKSASFNVSYRTTDSNVVTAHVLPAANPLIVTNHTAQTVQVQFATDDGYAASNFSTLGDLSLLGTSNAGWSAAGSSFTCATVDGGSGCTLVLTYSPTLSGDTGTLHIPFTYTNNAGGAGSGSLNLVYKAS